MYIKVREAVFCSSAKTLYIKIREAVVCSFVTTQGQGSCIL
jgi:hypothetical protein